MVVDRQITAEESDLVVPAPGTQAFVDRMKALAHMIENEATRENWYMVELKAVELATMCDIRRTPRRG